MKLKKISACLLVSAMTIAQLVGCGSSATTENAGGDAAKSTEAAETKAADTASADTAEGTSTVSLYATGSDNVRAIFEELVEDFNTNSEYASKYQVELNFQLSGTGAAAMTDGLAAAVKADQQGDYDIVDLSGDDLSKVVSLIGEESLTKLDASKMPNAAHVTAKSAIATDYAQPYRGTTVILAYDSKAVPTPPKTVDELVEWMKANPGRFAYNAPGTGGAGDSFARTSVYNFLPEEALTSSDASWVDKWDEGFSYLADIHQYMYQSGGSIVYPAKNQATLDLLNQGEIDMCPNWADMVLSQRASGAIKDTIKITQIQPSLTGSLQSLVIPKISDNVDGAYAFMDYMISDRAQEMMLKDMAAIPLVDTSKMDMTGYEDLQTLDVANFRLMSIGDLSTQFNERWDSEIGSIG